MGNLCSNLQVFCGQNCRYSNSPKNHNGFQKTKKPNLSIKIKAKPITKPIRNTISLPCKKPFSVIDYYIKGADDFPLEGWIHPCSRCNVPTSRTILNGTIMMCGRCQKKTTAVL